MIAWFENLREASMSTFSDSKSLQRRLEEEMVAFMRLAPGTTSLTR